MHFSTSLLVYGNDSIVGLQGYNQWLKENEACVSRGQEKTKKKSEERDIVLRLAVTAMLIIGGIVFAVGVMNPREDPRKGLEKLTQMEEADTAEIDAQIKELEEAERAADEAWANRSVSEKFANSYVLGDSIAQGLYESQALDKSFVTAERDTGVCETEVSMIKNHVSKAVEISPQVLFLAYGKNDIKAASGDAEIFGAAYRRVLKELKEKLPDTKIYVNSILPVTQEVIDEDELYRNIPEYNRKLMELCEEEGVTFIDNKSLVKDEYYTEDGIHMTSDYYGEWVNHMAEATKL